MLILNLKHDDGERELNLSAKDLPEMIRKMKSWNDFESSMDFMRKTKRYKKSPKKIEKEELKSGWYWFKEGDQ